jgi:hypothetical protein
MDNYNFPHKKSTPISRVVFDHTTTVDMDDGQALPPFLEDNHVWHIVRRREGRTLWRRIYPTTETETSFQT